MNMNKLENLSYSTIYEHFLTLIMIQYLHINQINFTCLILMYNLKYFIRSLFLPRIYKILNPISFQYILAIYLSRYRT